MTPAPAPATAPPASPRSPRAAPASAEDARDGTVIPKIVYSVLALLPLALLGLYAFAKAGVLTAQTSAEKIPWDLSVVITALLTTGVLGIAAARAAPRLVAQAKDDGATGRMARWELTLLLASFPLAAAVCLIAFLAWLGILAGLGPLAFTPMTPPILGAVAILVAIAPYGLFVHARERRIRAIEERFPDFLRDLNEAYNGGITMAQAVRTSAKGDYGVLTPEIQRMSQLVSWGILFPDALRRFGDRVGTPLVQRSVALIIKATQAGGSVKDVLAAAAKDAREIHALESERRLNMTLYTVVIYVSFGVFLGIIAVLQGLFLPAILASTTALPSNLLAEVSSGARMTYEQFRFVYFNVGLTQALGSGIVAGIMTEDSVAAGLKHASIMVLISLLVLGFLI